MASRNGNPNEIAVNPNEIAVDDNANDLRLFNEAGELNVALFETVPINELVMGNAADDTKAQRAYSIVKEQELEITEIPPGDDRWMWLPQTAIERVYSFLGDCDRGNASITCKNWREAFYSADLWKTRRYRFNGFMATKRVGAKAAGFARHLGCYLKNLSIDCDEPLWYLVRKFQVYINTFFDGLINKSKSSAVCQLRSFAVVGAQVDTVWRSEPTIKAFAKTLVEFLDTQFHLHKVDFSDTLLPLAYGLRVLESLAKHNYRTVTYLDIRDFFPKHLMVCDVPRFRTILSHFRSVEQLKLSYNCISAEVLRMMRHCFNGMQHLYIVASDNHPFDSMEVDSVFWYRLRKTFRRLKVRMSIRYILHAEEIKKILTSEIPLTRLSILRDRRDSRKYHENWSDVLRCIGRRYGSTLVRARFVLSSCHEQIDDALIDFLLACRHLLILELECALKISTLDKICRLQEEYKIGLARCDIGLENVNMRDIMELTDVQAKHKNMITSRDLDFIFEPLENP